MGAGNWSQKTGALFQGILRSSMWQEHGFMGGGKGACGWRDWVGELGSGISGDGEGKDA